MRYVLATVVLALPFLVSGQASAQEEDEGRPRRGGDMRARMLEEFDADGDGELSDEERQTARETMRERRGDRPGRGGQARGEGRGGEGRGPAGEGRGPGGRGPGFGLGGGDPNRLFDRFDENGDGQLSREEFMKLTEWTREMRERAVGPGQGGRGPRGEGAGGPGRGGPRGDRPARPQRPRGDDPAASEAPAEDGSST